MEIVIVPWSRIFFFLKMDDIDSGEMRFQQDGTTWHTAPQTSTYWSQNLAIILVNLPVLAPYALVGVRGADIYKCTSQLSSKGLRCDTYGLFPVEMHKVTGYWQQLTPWRPILFVYSRNKFKWGLCETMGRFLPVSIGFILMTIKM